MTDREELYRRLAQARRMASEHIDPLTKSRLAALVAELETQLAAAEAKDSDSPPD